MSDANLQALGFGTQRFSKPMGWFLLLLVAAPRALFGGESIPAPSTYSQNERETLTVQAKDAEQNLVKKVAPVYPPLPRQARIQGIVKIEVLISKTGTVDSYKVLNGHPLLVQAAINAVKQWQYKPFLVDDQPVTASTVVEVPFSLGIPEPKQEAWLTDNQTYFRREEECRAFLKERRFAEAEASCRSLIQLSEKLSLEQQMERMTANELSGRALYQLNKFAEALIFFQRELAIGIARLKPTDAELGYAYYHAAKAYYATGQVQEAQVHYERAEATLRGAREHIKSEFLKNEYSRVIQLLLQDYVVLLRQTGQEDAARKAQQRADTIAREIYP